MLGKKRGKQFSLSVLTLGLVMFLPEFALGQPPLPSVDDENIVLSISGALVILLAVGTSYGIKRMKK